MFGLTVPKILFIRGVFKRDCVGDDFLEKKIIDNMKSSQITEYNINDNIVDYDECNAEQVYKKIPTIFETLEDWPDKTNLLCWHCSLSFDSVPIFIPRVIEPVISKNKFRKYSIVVFGVFCSFGDALEFVQASNWSIMDKIEAFNKLKHLYKIFYGEKLKENINYPDVYDMVQYGGDISINQYRKLIKMAISNQV